MNWRTTILGISLFSLTCASCSQKENAVTPAASNRSSEYTSAHQEALRDSLPFEDKRDFDEHDRGFIAAPDYRRIADKSGNTVWAIGKYDFLLTGEDFDSIHPSLQRQATLNMNYVMPDVGEQLVVEMSNGTLTSIAGFTIPDADVTVTIDRSALLPVMMKQVTLGDQIRAGKAEVNGSLRVLAQLRSTLVEFDPVFEIMPGTRQ